MNKKYILSLFIILNLLALPALCATKTVKGYYRKSTGKYVQSYKRTAPNRTRMDNFSTKGNYNYYTGKKGYKSQFK